MTRHYLDHASGAPLRPVARQAMAAWEAEGITADPGRLHLEGRRARAALEDARDQVAGLFGVRARQVVFTSGGTESINAAVWGALHWRRNGGHNNPISPAAPVVCAAVEHSAAREASSRLAPVVAPAVDRTGRVEAGAIDDAIAECGRAFGSAPSLVHCQWANHEVGTVQPVHEVVERCRGHRVPVHVDAVAAAGHVPTNLGELGADLVSVSAHKMGGPPGIGATIVAPGQRFEPLLLGGDQERGRRGGLENLMAAIGFGAVAEFLASGDRLALEASVAREQTDRLRRGLTSVPGVTSFGHPVFRLPHLVCVGIADVAAEPVLLGLDQAGIAAHSGSSCSSESLEPSPVLEAMGVEADRSLRLSVGWSTTEDDIEACLAAFGPVVGGLRTLGQPIPQSAGT